MAVTAKSLPLNKPYAEENEDPREHLMHDPKPRGEMNDMVLESMHTTTWKFWTLAIVLTFLVLTCFIYEKNFKVLR